MATFFPFFQHSQGHTCPPTNKKGNISLAVKQSKVIVSFSGKLNSLNVRRRDIITVVIKFCEGCVMLL